MYRSIAVIGAGESGVGAALLAKKKNIQVFVSDYGMISADNKKELIDNNIPFEEGGHSFDKIDKAEVIVKSPGIPGASEVIRYFRLRHKKIISEIEFARPFFDGKIIGITGSNGKTTTTKLCYHVLKGSQYSVGMGGNVGISFARMLTNDPGYDWAVLELSSFQLEEIKEFNSDISIVLNITPDHLDRYDYDFWKYARAKWNLISSTRSNGLIILNSGNEACLEMHKRYPPPSRVIWIGEGENEILVSKDTGQIFEMKIRGIHNVFNASAVVAVARYLDIPESQIADGLASFDPVPHRMEIVASIGNLEFINDSKSTNIDACKVALESMDKPLVWIAGGTDKGNDYTVIADLVKSKVNAIVCLTADDSKLRKCFDQYFGNRIVTTRDTLEAVKMSMDFISEGTVLLSPACASFDLFNNYEHRGNSFKAAVLEIKNERNK